MKINIENQEIDGNIVNGYVSIQKDENANFFYVKTHIEVNGKNLIHHQNILSFLGKEVYKFMFDDENDFYTYEKGLKGK